MKIKKIISNFKKGIAVLMAGVMAFATVTPAMAQLDMSGHESVLTKEENGRYKWQQGNHEFSSFASKKENAFVVQKTSYGFEFLQTKNTTFTVLKGKETGYPEQLTEMSDTPVSLYGPDSDWKWFNLKNDNNKTDNIQVKWSNLRIFQCDDDGGNGRWVNVDVVRTVTGIEKYNSQNTAEYTATDGTKGIIDCHVALGPGLTSNAYIGIKEMKVENEFFEAGTDKKVSIKTNQTLTDIDSGQYVGIKADRMDGEYVADNSKLHYKYDNGTSIYYYPEMDNLDGGADIAMGFIFEGQKFTYTFGRIRVDEDGNEVEPSGVEQYVGSGQSMVRFPTPNPVKNVSDNNEEEVTSNRVEHMGDTWTYKVEQPITSNVPANFRYSNFSLTDSVEECMKVVDVDVYAENAKGTVKNVSDWFKISTTSVNNTIVTAELKNSDDAEFYKNAVYRLRIKVKMDVPENPTEEEWNALIAKWKNHGHLKEGGFDITENNTGYTIIDDNEKWTNQTTTVVPIPQKFVGVTGKVTETKHYTQRSLADRWYFDFSQTIDQNLNEDTYYKSFSLKDDIEECLKIINVQVLDATDKDVSDRFNVSTDNNRVIASAKDTKSAVFYSTSAYKLRIHVKMDVSENATEEQLEQLRSVWKAHGHYKESETVITEDNIGRTEINGVNEFTDRPDMNIELPKDEEGKPGLAITKDVNRYEHQVADTVQYTVKVWNTNPNADTAYYIIKDTSMPDDMVLDFNSIKVDGISESHYKLTQVGNGWELHYADDYAIPSGDTITITYNAKPTKELNGTLVDNTATAVAAGIPEKSDSEQVYINSPKVDVEKTVPSRKYKVGDTVGYKVTITNRNPGTFMRDLVLHDVINTDGLEIKEGTLAVLVGGKDMTTQYDVTYDEDGKGFTIVTPLNLKNGSIPCIDNAPYSSIINWCDKIVVTYDATITDNVAITNKLSNTFMVPATENTNCDLIRDDEDIPSGGGSDDAEIELKGPQLDIQKTSNKQQYSVDEEGKYTLTVKQTKEELIAKNVVITDTFAQEKGMVINKDSIKVTKNGKDITEQCNIEADAACFEIITNNDLTDEDVMKVTYTVKFSEDGVYDNIAVADSDNTPNASDDNEVTVTTPAPELSIIKSSDSNEYKVNDIGTYTLKVKQKVANTTAKNVVIADTFDKEGIEILTPTVKVIKNDIDITSQCVITTTDERGFKIVTNSDLSNKDTITVTYQVRFLVEGKYNNIAVADSDNTDEVSDDNTVTVKISETNAVITKVADRKNYKAGEVVKYTITAHVTKENTSAINAVITDNVPRELVLNGKSIKVTGIDDYSVWYKNNKFKVTIPELPYGKTVKITFEAKVLKAAKGKDIVNTATITGDNIPDDSDDDTISVPKEPVEPPAIPRTPTPSYTAPPTGGNAINIGWLLIFIGLGFTILSRILCMWMNRKKEKNKEK